MKHTSSHIMFLFIVLLIVGCDINKYDLEKVDIINFSNLYTESPPLKKCFKSNLIQNLDDNSYFIPAVTQNNQLGVFHISELGAYISFDVIGPAVQCSDFIKVKGNYYVLANEAKYAKVYQLSSSFQVLNEISFGDIVDNTDILKVEGYDLYYDEITDDIYIAGLCERNIIGDQMMVMRLDLELEQVWPNPKKYFDLSPGFSIDAYDDTQLVVAGIKRGESPFLVRMARTGNLLGTIILLDDLGLDSLNSIQIIDTSIFITGTSIDVNPQSIIAQYSFDGINTAVQNSSFGIGCDPLSSITYHQNITEDGDILALADDKSLNELHITKYDPFTPDLSWNQCYPNLDNAIDIQSLSGIQTQDRTFAFAALESKDGVNYFLRLIKTDRLGDVRY